MNRFRSVFREQFLITQENSMKCSIRGNQRTGKQGGAEQTEANINGSDTSLSKEKFSCVQKSFVVCFLIYF